MSQRYDTREQAKTLTMTWRTLSIFRRFSCFLTIAVARNIRASLAARSLNNLDSRSVSTLHIGEFSRSAARVECILGIA